LFVHSSSLPPVDDDEQATTIAASKPSGIHRMAS
jgi:hypothetical protein